METQTMKKMVEMETQTMNKVSNFDEQDYENAIDVIVDLNEQVKNLNEVMEKMGERYSELSAKQIKQYEDIIRKIFATIGIDPSALTSLDDENLINLMQTYREAIEDSVKIKDVSAMELQDIKELKKQLSKLTSVAKVIGKRKRGAQEEIGSQKFDLSKKRKLKTLSKKRQMNPTPGRSMRHVPKRITNKPARLSMINLPKSKQGMMKNARAEDKSAPTTSAGRILPSRILRSRNR
jgi:hypothetical protein